MSIRLRGLVVAIIFFSLGIGSLIVFPNLRWIWIPIVPFPVKYLGSAFFILIGIYGLIIFVRGRE